MGILHPTYEEGVVALGAGGHDGYLSQAWRNRETDDDLLAANILGLMFDRLPKRQEEVK